MPSYRHRTTGETVNAERFDSGAWRWPLGCQRWPDDNGFNPNDGSAGYIEEGNTRQHLFDGTWIVKREPWTLSDDLFHKVYEEVR